MKKSPINKQKIVVHLTLMEQIILRKPSVSIKCRY